MKVSPGRGMTWLYAPFPSRWWPGESQYVVPAECAATTSARPWAVDTSTAPDGGASGPSNAAPPHVGLGGVVGFFDAGSVRGRSAGDLWNGGLRTTIGRRVPRGDPENDSRRDGENDAGRRPPPRRQLRN